MAIMKRSPFQELDSMERQIRRVFEQVGFAPTLLPAADIYETKNEFVVEVDVPGYEEKEIEIEVFDHTLVVRGEQRETTEKEEKSFRLHERLEREFERRFALPAEADTDHVKAKFVKGVVEVHTPKIETAKRRKVAFQRA